MALDGATVSTMAVHDEPIITRAVHKGWMDGRTQRKRHRRHNTSVESMKGEVLGSLVSGGLWPRKADRTTGQRQGIGVKD